MAMQARIACCVTLLAAAALLGCAGGALEIVADPPVKFLDDEKKSKFIIAIDRDGDATEPSTVPGMRTIVMADRTGKKYSCRLPAEDQPAAANATAAGKAEAGVKKQKQTPAELLDELAALCFYRAEDWWTYEVCFQKHVRQFHREQAADGSARVAVEYSLGEYNASAMDTNLVQVDTSPGQKDLKYVSQLYDSGDACDLTGGRRQTEVRYSCGEGAKDLIVSIKEPSTCHYVMNVRTPRLCRHPKFQEAAVPVAHILCSAVPAQLDAEQQAEEGAAGGGETEGAATASEAAEQEVASGGAVGVAGDTEQADDGVVNVAAEQEAASGRAAGTADDAEEEIGGFIDPYLEADEGAPADDGANAELATAEAAGEQSPDAGAAGGGVAGGAGEAVEQQPAETAADSGGEADGGAQAAGGGMPAGVAAFEDAPAQAAAHDEL